MGLPVGYEFNLVITGFGDESNQIAKSINERGIVGLRYIEGASEWDTNSKVISLNAYRENKARVQEGYDIAIIIVSENKIDEYLKSIRDIGKNSGVTLAFVMNAEDKDFSKYQGLRELVDSVFPITTTKNQLEDTYGAIRAIIESFTVQTITGVDVTDIAHIVRDAGIGLTIQFKVPQNGDIVEYLEKHVVLHLTRGQPLDAHGALISATGMSDLQYATEFLNENSCFGISCVINLREDTGGSTGNYREITVVFTGISS